MLLDHPCPDADAAHRVDLTHLPVYTVDDESTTEVDDGLSVVVDGDGSSRYWIHVADPTRWLQPGRCLNDTDQLSQGGGLACTQSTVTSGKACGLIGNLNIRSLMRMSG